MRDRLGEGRNVAVIVGYEGGAAILEDLDWEYEFLPHELKFWQHDRKGVATWIEGMTCG